MELKNAMKRIGVVGLIALTTFAISPIIPMPNRAIVMVIIYAMCIASTGVTMAMYISDAETIKEEIRIYRLIEENYKKEQKENSELRRMLQEKEQEGVLLKKIVMAIAIDEVERIESENSKKKKGGEKNGGTTKEEASKEVEI